MHFLLSCDFYCNERSTLIKAVQEFTPIAGFDDEMKFNYLMSCSDYELSKVVMDFVHIAMSKRKDHLSDNM